MSANVRGEEARLSMQTKDEPKRGRSPGYSTEIAQTICHRLAKGESLRATVPIPRCRLEPRYSAGSPAMRNFAARTRSRATVWLKTCGRNSGNRRRQQPRHIEHRRRRIKARRRILAYLAPKKYRYR